MCAARHPRPRPSEPIYRLARDPAAPRLLLPFLLLSAALVLAGGASARPARCSSSSSRLSPLFLFPSGGHGHGRRLRMHGRGAAGLAARRVLGGGSRVRAAEHARTRRRRMGGLRRARALEACAGGVLARGCSEVGRAGPLGGKGGWEGMG